MNIADSAILQERFLRRSSTPDYLTVSAIRTELRYRRKHILGSHISARELVCVDTTVCDEIVAELSHYLTERTMCFWKDHSADDTLCYRFYVLTLYALASENVGNESLDDVIQLAGCLARSKDVFVSVLSKLLPVDMIAELFSFADSCDNSYFTGYFEDAVLGAVAVFLGVLKDPVDL